MRNRLQALLFIAFALGGCSAAPTQLPLADPSVAGLDASREAVILERKRTTVRFATDGTSVLDVTVSARLQSEAGVKDLAVLKFPYSVDSQKIDVEYVRVRKPGGAVIITPATNFLEMPADLAREAPMYSDLHEKHILVKGMGVGDVLEYHLRLQTLKAQVPGQFWFDYSLLKDQIILDQELEVQIPRAIEIRISSPGSKPEVREEGDQKILRWQHRNLTRQETKSGRNLLEAPVPSIQVSTFHSWEEVGKWYAGLQRPQVQITAAIRAKAAELTNGLVQDEDRIRALYEFVSTRFHYISLSFGMGRYQPHSSDEVFGNEYGDCKDKHTLLAALLKASGYEAWPALVRAFGKIDPELPSPGQFNHVMTVVPLGGGLVWMDTTAEVAPYGFLFVGVRDRPALLIPSSKPASLVTVPAELPFPSRQDLLIKGKYDETGRLSAQVEQSFRGDSELLVRQTFRRMPSPRWKEMLQNGSNMIRNRGEVSAVRASDLENARRPFRISYDLACAPDPNWEHHQFADPLPPFGFERGNPDEKAPDEPLFLGAPGEILFQAKLELPKGILVKAPENVFLSEDCAEYRARYSVESGILSIERRFTIKRKTVALKDWESFKRFRKAIEADETQLLGERGSSNFKASSVPEAARSYESGEAALLREDFSAAEACFRRSLELDPSCPGAHANLGACYFSRNDWERGVEEVRKEVHYHPEFQRGHLFLANVFTRSQRTDEAIVEWQKVLGLDPRNLEALTCLPPLLLAKGKREEAFRVMESAVAADPNNRGQRLKLAEYFLQNAEPGKGLAHIQQAIQQDSGPEDLNQAAYILAEANTELDLAMGFAEKAVRELEIRTAKPSEDPENGLALTRRLLQAWDTLGWVSFRKGDIVRAETFVRSAWKLSQNGVVGDHLAQIYERQGRKKEAEYQYALADAGLGGNKKEIERRFKALSGKDFGSVSKHVDARGKTLAWPQERLGQLRTIRLPLKLAKGGNGTFLFVLSREGIESITFQKGDERLKALTEKISKNAIRTEFPDDGPERIVRQGILSCGPSDSILTLLSDPSRLVTGPDGINNHLPD